MDAATRKRLEAAGWRVGSGAEFLDLSTEEARLIETKLALGDHLRRVRREHHLTQVQLARRIGSSQSRVAKMEVADSSVTLDLMVKTLFALGVSSDELGRTIGAIAN